MGQVACRSPASFLRPHRPVRHHRKRRVRLQIHHFVDQKPLPVARHCIGRNDPKSPGAELEERDRRADIEALAASHLHGHQLPVSRVVEQRTSIRPPAWTAAPTGRDLPLAIASRELLHVYFKLARPIRGVCQPPPVGRERTPRFTRWRLYHWERLRLTTTERR